MVKFVFILLHGLYDAVGLCLGGFLVLFLGLKIVDKWFYFQKFNVFFSLNTITGFWEVIGGRYLRYELLRPVGARVLTCDFRWAMPTAVILRPVGAGGRIVVEVDDILL